MVFSFLYYNTRLLCTLYHYLYQGGMGPGTFTKTIFQEIIVSKYICQNVFLKKNINQDNIVNLKHLIVQLKILLDWYDLMMISSDISAAEMGPKSGATGLGSPTR